MKNHHLELIESVSDDLKDCGGCQIQELDYNKQLELKTNEVKQVISRIGKLENVEIHETIGMQSTL